MIRKQLYLEEAQNKALKQRAKELGVSEAELVRRALDSLLWNEPVSPAVKDNKEILQEIFKEADEIAATHRFPEGYRLNRQELYEEDKRFSHWDRE
jgi:hypothetical protein